MNKLAIIATFVAASVVFPTLAKPVEITWQEPKKYTDIRAANGGSKAFRERVFSQLQQHFNKEAEKKLPDGMALKVTVTDINLAGDVRFNFGMNQEIRVVKDIYWPMLKFDYQLVENGKVIKQDSVTLKDMSFLNRGINKANGGSYFYEKRLISDWFRKDVQQTLVQLQKRDTAVMS